MTTQNIALFKALGSKMDYLSQRQRVISQNIANADTPDYKPQDLKPVDFGTVLKSVTQSGSVTINATNPMHVGFEGKVADPKEAKQKQVYEVAPDGNSVIMEEQMLNSNQTIMDYNLMTSLYQKNIQMMKIAIGAQ
ncbi:MAG: flagellar basal body rod protein FlgB [Alphaproteobacteria bacterium]